MINTIVISSGKINSEKTLRCQREYRGQCKLALHVADTGLISNTHMELEYTPRNDSLVQG